MGLNLLGYNKQSKARGISLQYLFGDAWKEYVRIPLRTVMVV